MAILNENEVLEPGSPEAETFAGTPTKVLLLKGTKLLKLSAYQPSNTNAGGAVTPWWAAWDPTAEGDWGYDGIRKMSGSLGVSEKEIARVAAAVSYDWNDLTRVWKIMLTEDVYGWHGRIGSQWRRQDQPGGLRFPGGNMQYYIPHLCPWHITVLENLRAQ
jgi:hypothetical protein